MSIHSLGQSGDSPVKFTRHNENKEIEGRPKKDRFGSEMMQRPPHLDLFPSRHSQSPAPLPTPPTEQKTSSAILNSTFAKEPPAIMSPTTRFGSYGRRVSRSSFATSSSSDGAKSFVLDTDAHPNKYMHFYDRLDNKHGLAPPSQSEHQVKQDPTGTLKSTFPSTFPRYSIRDIADGEMFSLGI